MISDWFDNVNELGAPPARPATFCIRVQHSLIHRDRDFDPFEKFLELSIIHA